MSELSEEAVRHRASDGDGEKRGGRWQVFLLLAATWAVIGAITATQFWWMGMAPWHVAVRLATLDWGPWIFLSPFVLWLCARMPIEARTWKRAVPVHLAGCALVAAVSGACVAFGGPMLISDFGRMRMLPARPPPAPSEMRAPPAPGDQPRDESPPEVRPENRLIALGFFRARLGIPIYAVLVAAWHAWAYHRRSVDRERRALQAEARLAEARMAVLQSQLQPHFLFNTLNTISSLVYENPRAADEMICLLSELLRRVLANANRREIPLREELATADSYLAVQQVRFGEKLDVRREIDSRTLDLQVPTLLLQPLLENAFVHGLDLSAGRGVLDVRVRRRDGMLAIEVEDSGSGGVAPKNGRAEAGGALVEHFGLGNTRARLQAMYGTLHHFERGPRPGGGFRVQVEIPARAAAT